MKRIYARDEEHMKAIQYLHYIFKRNSEEIIPESIVNQKDDDFDDEQDDFSERG